MKNKFLLSFMIFSLFLLIIIRSSACTVTSDDYALEVLLKKPNLIYNQNILVEAKNIKDIDSEYIYKSHYNPNLVVIISKTQPPLLRIQCPVQGIEKKIPYFKIIPIQSFSNFELNLVNISSWEQQCIGEEPSKCVFEKGGVFVTVDKISEKRYTLSIEIIGKNISSCSSSEYCSGKCIYYFGEGKCIPRDTIVNIENLLKGTGTINDFVDITKHMKVEKGINNVYEMQPEYSCETDWKQALLKELTWLRLNSIINLDFADIENISQIAQIGRAGNSKIVYGQNNAKEKGWLYYNESISYTPNRIPNCQEFSKTIMPTGMVTFNSGKSYYYTIPLIITAFVFILFIVTLIVTQINLRRQNKRAGPVTTIYKAEK